MLYSMDAKCHDICHMHFEYTKYMELCFKSCSPSYSVLFFQFLNGTGESRGQDLSVSTGEGLQDSIMDEHILVLGGSKNELYCKCY